MRSRGRSGPAAPDPRQPRRQCDQVHRDRARSWWPRRTRRANRRRRILQRRGERHGHRHPARQAGDRSSSPSSRPMARPPAYGGTGLGLSICTAGGSWAGGSGSKSRPGRGHVSIVSRDSASSLPPAADCPRRASAVLRGLPILVDDECSTGPCMPRSAWLGRPEPAGCPGLASASASGAPPPNRPLPVVHRPPDAGARWTATRQDRASRDDSPRCPRQLVRVRAIRAATPAARAARWSAAPGQAGPGAPLLRRWPLRSARPPRVRLSTAGGASASRG